MDPVAFQVEDQEHDAADRPCQRVGGEDDPAFLHDRHDDADIGHAQHAPRAEHDEHRHHGASRSAHDGGNAMRKRQHTEKQRLDLYLLHADVDRVGVLCKERQQRPCKQQHGHADQLRDDHAAHDPEDGAFLGAVVLPCSEVLADERRQRHGVAGDGQKGKALQLGIGAAARDGILAEDIDIGLHDDVCKGDDGVLHAGGQTVADDLAQHRLFHADRAQPEPVAVAAAHQPKNAQQGADKLRNGGRQRGSPDATIQHTDQKIIQRHIEHRREDQVVQRRLAVADGAQYAHTEVIHNDRDRAEEVEAEILHGVSKVALLRLHQAQQQRRGQNADDREQQTREQAERNGRMDRRVELFFVLRAVIARDDNARAHGDTGEKADKQKHEAARGGHGGIFGIGTEMTDDPSVGCVIKLLKDLPEQDRHGKKRQILPDRSFRQGHVLLHRTPRSACGTFHGYCSPPYRSTITHSDALRHLFLSFLAG